ncbi:N-acetyltransferase [Sphaerisporangium krabiense]|uniref:GNAT superfamily N-acetyltransferase n=1 Tax=Sphaerisporangium krabiense TaxID=763782 RepID=A0A7W9DU25_9ACTN|nr:GNAT family N-acetyltransferase [Sphaerisporangium krabiense]MBB5630669.1 GNAT superfamily N-acetyltransferase [Sphaerisporangium krabiense]GII62374.1 N-acetyltransferase [Sphaerisporangium krabiense]
MEMVIFPATPQDVPALARMRRDAEDWLAAQGIRQWPQGHVAPERIAEQIDRSEWYMARSGEVPCGAFRLLWSDPGVWEGRDTLAAYVHGLMIDRGHAGGGVGAAMLAWVEDRARGAGTDLVRLDCVEHNTRLRRYYADLGFLEVGLRTFSPRWTGVLLEKRLTSEC